MFKNKSFIRCSADITDAFSTGTIPFDLEDDLFYKAVKEKYKVHIILCKYVCSSNGSYLTIYITGGPPEFYNIIENMQKKSILTMPEIHEPNKFPNSVVQLSQRISDEYFATHSVKKNKKKLEIFIYDFNQHLFNYLYGHSTPALKDLLSNKYHLDEYDVFVQSEPAVTMLVDDRAHYEELLTRKKEVMHDCYTVLSKLDKFHVLTEDEVEVKIFLKSEVDMNAFQKR